MAFFQSPPELTNQFQDDEALRSYLTRALPADVLESITPELLEMGETAVDLYGLQLEDRLNEPRLIPWDAWGNRIDRIEVSPLWQRAAVIAAEKGLVATAYEKKHGRFSRVHQFALVYLFDASSDVYTCPLAMTDGAAKTLSVHGNPALLERAFGHLTSRDPKHMWTSGQWMTERTGGSDVGLTETSARGPDENGDYRLYGTKWFTSATTSQMALTLARPEGNPPGGRGLALFYLNVLGKNGNAPGILVNRLKDKLGTRKVPTAELTLDGAVATPVTGLDGGVRAIAPMLNVTRSWNTVAAVSSMRRAVALARSYAKRRVQFGAPLTDKPLHLDTLAGMQAEVEAALHLAFTVTELLGKEEAGEATEAELRLLRVITPIAKLTTAKQAVAVVSEALECFGGAGYVEDTGLPRLLRDAQVLPIWEGTTNVLSLDTLRAIAKEQSLDEIGALIKEATGHAKEPRLARAGGKARDAVERTREFLQTTLAEAPLELETHARRVALALGRAVELALLVRHAQWALDHGDARPQSAALRFSSHPMLVPHTDENLSRELANRLINCR
jgi:alkylation response protein AidB-like acyl-CoA dehydrogenase